MEWQYDGMARWQNVRMAKDKIIIYWISIVWWNIYIGLPLNFNTTPFIKLNYRNFR